LLWALRKSDARSPTDLGFVPFEHSSGVPMTLGAAAVVGVRLIVWCREGGRQIEPELAELARHRGATTTVVEWREEARLLPVCESANVDLVVTGTERR